VGRASSGRRARPGDTSHLGLAPGVSISHVSILPGFTSETIEVANPNGRGGDQRPRMPRYGVETDDRLRIAWAARAKVKGRPNSTPSAIKSLPHKTALGVSMVASEHGNAAAKPSS